jgi:hypothetical protein
MICANHMNTTQAATFWTREYASKTKHWEKWYERTTEINAFFFLISFLQHYNVGMRRHRRGSLCWFNGIFFYREPSFGVFKIPSDSNSFTFTGPISFLEPFYAPHTFHSLSHLLSNYLEFSWLLRTTAGPVEFKSLPMPRHQGRWK